ncbi:hypothetical protein fugu_005523 [Takifugu bimaculatus]|uniref:Uncharacterized protein n=1 Tax=Takifugu bimaculatus TaxID=433685 RepID=A0A4Z2BC97_9TELE|nr:hypothetical protein fugu_005523 [Takifugu bimaculatus]
MEYPGRQREAEATRGKSRREEGQEETDGCSHQDDLPPPYLLLLLLLLLGSIQSSLVNCAHSSG